MDAEQFCRLKKFFKEIYAFETELQRKAGFSLNEVLAMCLIANGKETPTELAAETGLSLSRLSRVLGSLEVKGFIGSVNGSGDKRRKNFHLTKDGQVKYNEIKKMKFRLPELP